MSIIRLCRLFLLLLGVGVFAALPGCGRTGLELQGHLVGREAEAKRVGAARLSELSEWHIVVLPHAKPFPCGRVSEAYGCTSHDLKQRTAYVEIAMLEGGSLDQTAYRHELTHIVLLERTGDGDGNHLLDIWDEPESQAKGIR